MKKMYLILVLAFAGIQAQAQFSVGLSGGYTNSWQEYGDVNLPENAEIDVDGRNLSLQLYYRISPYLSVGIEPGFVERGAACVPGWQPIFSGDTQFLLDYIEAPVMIAGHLPFFKKRLELSGKIGYSGSYLASAKRKEIHLNNDTPAEFFDIDLDDQNTILNRWDLGIQSALGVAYNIGLHQIFVEGGFYQGVQDAEKWNQSMNRSISYKLGYCIQVGK